MLHCSPQTSAFHWLALSFAALLSLSVHSICNLCGPSCERSRKSLSVGEATVQWWFSLREHSLPEQGLTTAARGLAHYRSCTSSLRAQAETESEGQPGDFSVGPFYLQIFWILPTFPCRFFSSCLVLCTLWVNKFHGFIFSCASLCPHHCYLHAEHISHKHKCFSVPQKFLNETPQTPCCQV